MSTNDVIERLDSAVTALASIDLAELSDAAIEESLEQLSMALCRVDLLLSRIADETRSRGFTIVEVIAQITEGIPIETEAKAA